MTDQTAFGPQGPNYATTRPPHDPKASAGIDTWFKNCSAAGAKDGTFATADFFNVIIGNLRYLVRTAGVTLDDYDDTMLWQAIQALTGASRILTAPKTLYVNASTGSDNNQGLTPTTAFQTLTRAAAEIANWNLNGFDITINIADGNYTGVAAPKMAGSGNVFWIGNPTSPSNVVITGTNQTAFAAAGVSHQLNGVKIQSTGIGGGIGAFSNAYLIAKNIEWGNNTGAMIWAVYASTIRLDGSLKISGGSPGHAYSPGVFAAAWNSSTIDCTNISSPPTLTVVGTPAFGTAFVQAQSLSNIAMLFASVVGGATGQRYFANLNSIINTNGGGASYFPGDVAGSVSTGAQYI